MADNIILEIKDLSCSYSLRPDNTVLRVDRLNLHSGRIIFLLGASGSGKSTLLETLGLMNNTITTGSVKLRVSADDTCDFSELWKQDDLLRIAEIRKNHLSFIFQNTNLMENFTAYENICLSQMIKTGVTQEVAMDGAMNLMNQVGLPLQEVSTGKLSVNLSGGQRQRVSFVRALNNDFKLLLCDEPTGNLDETNANELLNIVRNNIGQDKTAIIVSHDISLAMKYADQIVLITRDEGKAYGEVHDHNIFERRQWESLDQSGLYEFRRKLSSQFRSDTVTQGGNREKDTDTKVPARSYRELFRTKEGRVLFGKQNLNLAILVTIISITFIAIGFANGALDYLEKKYKDPFVRLLPVGIPWAKSSSSSVDEITDALNDPEIRNHYRIDTVTAFKEFMMPMFNQETRKSEFLKGRLISVDDPINDYLFDPRNIVSGHKSFVDETDLGMVVTVKLLDRLGYPLDARVVYIDNDDKDTSVSPPVKFMVPVPVRAVVRELPGKNSFLITNFFFSSWITHEECVFDFREQTKKLIYFAEGDKAFAKEFAQAIEKISGSFVLKEEVPVDRDDPDANYLSIDDMDEEESASGESDEMVDDSGAENIQASPDTGSVDDATPVEMETLEYTVDIGWEDSCYVMSTGGYEVSVSLDSKPYYYATTERIHKAIESSEFFRNNASRIRRIFDYGRAPQLEDEFSNDFLCVIFKEDGLDSISAFSTYMFSALNEGKAKEQSSVIDVDAGAIQEKNNFNYISKMTRLISVLLIAFSILSISLFISNLLKTHLNKVKMNLGTFKAFGLSDKESVGIYMGIMTRFIVTGLVVSILVALVLGSVIGIWFKNWLNIEDEIRYFLLFAGQTYFLIFIILVVTFVTSWVNINRILSKTPGDLIYNR